MGLPTKGKYDEILVAFSLADKAYLSKLTKAIQKRTVKKKAGHNVGNRVIVRAFITAIRQSTSGSKDLHGLTTCETEADIISCLRHYLDYGIKGQPLEPPHVIAQTKEAANARTSK